MASPPVKFVRALESTKDPFITSNNAGRFFGKLLYEFWGFVVNGGINPLVPGGFATGGINYPAGFESGSVLASGIDGRTRFGDSRFFADSISLATLNLTGALNNKYLVTWISGSTSHDDGIYRIISADDQGLIVDNNNGGTARLGNKPAFRDRSGIHFRIVDIERVVNLSGWADGQGMVLQFNAAADVNVGQRLSQAQIVHRASQESVGIVASPSGSWNGSAFTDGGTELTTVWFDSGTGQGVFHLMGGKDFIIVHVDGVGGDWQTSIRQAGLHIEIPQRLYPRDNDPNPITWMSWGGSGAGSISQTSTTPSSYYNGFRMIGFDGVTRQWETLVRSPHGERVDTNHSAINSGLWEEFEAGERFYQMNYNPRLEKLLSTDGVLHLNVAGQFSFARCRLRRVRFTSDDRVAGHRFGTDWVFTDLGILWPWNNTVMPHGPFWEGV